MSADFTQGPWRYFKQTHLRHKTCTQFVIESNVRKYMLTAEVWQTADDPDAVAEVEANVRLASTAPTLYAALQKAQETLRHLHQDKQGLQSTDIKTTLKIITKALHEAKDHSTPSTSGQPA